MVARRFKDKGPWKEGEKPKQMVGERTEERNNQNSDLPSVWSETFAETLFEMRGVLAMVFCRSEKENI